MEVRETSDGSESLSLSGQLEDSVNEITFFSSERSVRTAGSNLNRESTGWKNFSIPHHNFRYSDPFLSPIT